MKLLILNASPKRKGGASRFFSGLLRLSLPGVRKESASLCGRQDFERVLELLPGADAVCISVPLYVDGLPSHVVEFLSLAEEYCRARSCLFRLYALSNNGFLEGKQNRPVLRMLRSWCERTGVAWCGGIGIGGGTMLRVLGIVCPVLVGATLLQAAFSLFSAGRVPGELWLSLAWQIFAWLFLNSGVLFCMARLSAAIRGGRASADRFTRVMLPSFLFVPIADIFMVLSSLFHGRFLFTLLKQDSRRS